ncbi:hypothetical protein HPB50_022405 [Hyalomma asiaticum]|uniref:Uncharacterized protein n=1 Tax=Hyalomma asiaticum TaxID=266040 RepID=A0ACB7TRI5_HYAAI|nr:hypothetical protein HPB50_022405 [Hyalomma asiaticum]
MARNVNPVHDKRRCRARAVAFLKQIKKRDIKASFVGAAEHSGAKTFAVVVVDSSGKTSNSASIRTSDPEVAEQAAIAFALLYGVENLWRFRNGRLFRRIASPSKLLNCLLRLWNAEALTHHSMHWFTAHVGSTYPRFNKEGCDSLLRSCALDKQILTVQRAATGPASLQPGFDGAECPRCLPCDCACTLSESLRLRKAKQNESVAPRRRTRNVPITRRQRGLPNILNREASMDGTLCRLRTMKEAMARGYPASPAKKATDPDKAWLGCR